MTCQGTNNLGEPCLNPTVGEDGWCVFHRPGPEGERQREAMRAEALRDRRVKREKREKEQLAKRVEAVEECPPKPATLEDNAEWASWVAWALRGGTIDARTAEALSKALTTHRYALEKKDLAREVASLRKQVEQMRASAPGARRSRRAID